MTLPVKEFWTLTDNELFDTLKTSLNGLTNEEAQNRLNSFGPNILKKHKASDELTLLLNQFKSPIILILIFAAGLSFFLRDPVDAVIIMSIILISGFLGFWQERGANHAVDKLLEIVKIKVSIIRDGVQHDIPTEDVVPGDIVMLSAGDSIPGDCLILEAKDFFVDEATLTGETFPVEKKPGVLPRETQLNQRVNSLFMGTHVISGSAKAVIVRTGLNTEFRNVSQRLQLRPPETEFQRGIRLFGYLLIEVTLMLVIAIFAINVFLHRPVIEAFLFSLALAVGLTPQLLPAIISVNLAHGAKLMGANKVIVKRLSSIENFGSMNVLCSDKTGTLTEGTVQLKSALDSEGSDSDKTLLYAYLNAYYETGFVNPIDKALREYNHFDITGYEKLDEIPYDFNRKRLSILVSNAGKHIIITKGAFKDILSVCSSVELKNGDIAEISTIKDKITENFNNFSNTGFRTLGIAYKDAGTISHIGKEQENSMIFLGFLILFDPPKQGITETLSKIKHLGVDVKIITGDNFSVASNISHQIGFPDAKILTGTQLWKLSDEALIHQVQKINIFAEVEPNQKERIILALKKAGNVVGYIGDGINDASALHTADVGISVDTAVDVAKESADIVLLEKNLDVLIKGIEEGRKTFANTLKYIFMATSANFGNMFSMAGASLFLPFLPLLPKQILLINLMTDLPEMTISKDNVDSELIEKPHSWNSGFIRKFMITFGLLSSIFDYLTFGVLILVLRTTPEQFRTGWFLESVISAALIVLVVRSRKVFFVSRPGKYLLITTLSVVIFTFVLPYSPIAYLLGLSPLPPLFLFAMILIVAAYIIAAEFTKRLFYRMVNF